MTYDIRGSGAIIRVVGPGAQMAGTSSYESAEDAGREKKTKYYNRNEYCVVRELQSGLELQSGGREEAKCQLEGALERQCQLVIVEPQWQGDHAIRWIRFGNFLHKTAVISCVAGLVCLPLMPHRLFHYVCLPLGVVGVSCAVMYDVSWQFDPCCKYQVDHECHELTHIPSHELHSPSPVVLIFKNDKYRKRLHNLLAMATLTVLGWKMYKLFYS